MTQKSVVYGETDYFYINVCEIYIHKKNNTYLTAATAIKINNQYTVLLAERTMYIQEKCLMVYSGIQPVIQNTAEMYVC